MILHFICNKNISKRNRHANSLTYVFEDTRNVTLVGHKSKFCFQRNSLPSIELYVGPNRENYFIIFLEIFHFEVHTGTGQQNGTAQWLLCEYRTRHTHLSTFQHTVGPPSRSLVFSSCSFSKQVIVIAMSFLGGVSRVSAWGTIGVPLGFWISKAL